MTYSVDERGETFKYAAFLLYWAVLKTIKLKWVITMAEQKDPSALYIIWSVLAAFFGVQNKKNYDRDCAYVEKVGFGPYIIAGVILTVLFVLGVAGVVSLVLSNAGL